MMEVRIVLNIFVVLENVVEEMDIFIFFGLEVGNIFIFVVEMEIRDIFFDVRDGEKNIIFVELNEILKKV